MSDSTVFRFAKADGCIVHPQTSSATAGQWWLEPEQTSVYCAPKLD